MRARRSSPRSRRALAAVLGCSLVLGGLAPACVGDDPSGGTAVDSGSSGLPGPGSERGSCYPNGTCDAPLRCISQVCVRPDDGTDASMPNGSSAGGPGDSSNDTSPDAALQTIAEVIGEREELTKFRDAIAAAGVTVSEVLGGTTDHTLFAPTNAAFGSGTALMPEDDIEDHIAVGRIPAFPGTHPNLNGGDLVLSVVDGNELEVRLGGGAPGRVLERDIQASNGVIHIIDGVLRPAP